MARCVEKMKKYKELSAKPGTVNLYTYISNTRDNVDYPTYKAKGYFFGRGAVESGNKIVLQNICILPHKNSHIFGNHFRCKYRIA